MPHEIEQLWVPTPNTVSSRAIVQSVLKGGKPIDGPVVTIIDLAEDTK